METLIAFDSVCKAYDTGGRKLLAADHVSFEIGRGEFAVILGPSGAGKTTVLNLLGGMDTATSGSLSVGGRDITKFNDDELTAYRREDVGFVFQFYNLIPTLTAYENVALNRQLVKRALDAKETLGSVGLAEHLGQFPAQLSGGEQQRVSIARAICKNPKLLLCDEPTGALDSETGMQILSVLQRMNREQGRTVVVVTHNAAIAQAADRVIRMRSGRIQSVTVNENPARVEEVSW